MDGFKFNIGDIVKHKVGDGSKLLVLEQMAQFCYGGLRQNWYLCVLGIKERMLNGPGFEPKERYKFSEIELENM